MSAPYVGKRVRIEGTSKAEINGQMGRATGYDSEKMRYIVKLDNGQQNSFAVKNVVEVPEAEGGGGFPGFGGFPGMGGMGGMPGGMPPGVPNMDEIMRMLKLPPGVTPHMIGVALVVGLLCLWKLGFMKTIALGGACFFLFQNCFEPFQRAGGGVNGLKAGAKALGESVSAAIQQQTGRTVPPSQAGAGVLVLMALCLAYLLFSGGGRAPARGAPGSLPPRRPPAPGAGAGMRTKFANEDAAYAAGFKDGTAGTEFGASIPATATFSAPNAPPDPDPYYDMPPPPPPKKSGGFSMYKLFSLGMLLKQIYEFGSMGGQGFDAQRAIANIMAAPMQRKIMLGFSLVYLLGLSPF